MNVTFFRKRPLQIQLSKVGCKKQAALEAAPVQKEGRDGVTQPQAKRRLEPPEAERDKEAFSSGIFRGSMTQPTAGF